MRLITSGCALTNTPASAASCKSGLRTERSRPFSIGSLQESHGWDEPLRPWPCRSRLGAREVDAHEISRGRRVVYDTPRDRRRRSCAPRNLGQEESRVAGFHPQQELGENILLQALV